MVRPGAFHLLISIPELNPRSNLYSVFFLWLLNLRFAWCSQDNLYFWWWQCWHEVIMVIPPIFASDGETSSSLLSFMTMVWSNHHHSTNIHIWWWDQGCSIYILVYLSWIQAQTCTVYSSCGCQIRDLLGVLSTIPIFDDDNGME